MHLNTIVHIWHTSLFCSKCFLTFNTLCHILLWTLSLQILNLCIFMAFNQDIHDWWPIFFQYFKWSFTIHFGYPLPSWSGSVVWFFLPYLMWNKLIYDIVFKCNGLWSNHEDIILFYSYNQIPIFNLKDSSFTLWLIS